MFIMKDFIGICVPIANILLVFPFVKEIDQVKWGYEIHSNFELRISKMYIDILFQTISYIWNMRIWFPGQIYIYIYHCTSWCTYSCAQLLNCSSLSLPYFFVCISLFITSSNSINHSAHLSSCPFCYLSLLYRKENQIVLRSICLSLYRFVQYW
jgi:hypothetical protein